MAKKKRVQKSLSMSVVIPTYNRKETLVKCLNALDNQRTDHRVYDIVLIDDGSTDGTQAAVKNLNLSCNLSYFKQKNQGPGAARNFGIKKASRDIILLIGDDIIAKPNLIKEHLRVHEENPQNTVAALGFVDWSPKAKVTPLMKFLTEATGLQFAFHQIRDYSNAGFFYFYTCNISLKRSFLLQQKHIFDTGFTFAAFEDIDLGYRLEKQRLRIIYNPKALAYHHHQVTIDDYLKRQFKAGQMAVIFAQKHPELDEMVTGTKKVLTAGKSGMLSHTEESRFIDAISELEKLDLTKFREIRLADNHSCEELFTQLLYNLYSAALGNAYNGGIISKARSTKT